MSADEVEPVLRESQTLYVTLTNQTRCSDNGEIADISEAFNPGTGECVMDNVYRHR
jgi:hypothetical protein